MKKIFLITGAKGQDGLILSKILIKRGHKVYGIVKRKNYLNSINKVKYLKINLSNKKQILNLLLKIKPNVVIHFGSSNPSYDELKVKKNFYDKNFLDTKNLIDSLLFYKKSVKFIFANSAQIIANKNTKKKINEKNRFDYNSSYTKFRLNIFKYLEKKKNSKFRFSNLILFNHDSKFRNVKFLLPRIAKYVKERDIYSLSEIYNQNISGDFSHAEDICYAIYLLSVKNIAIDNLILSSGKKTKINDVIKFLVNLSGLNHKFPTPKNSKQMVCGDISLAKRILKWKIKKNVFIASKEIYKTLK
jgi:GDPmannose 4,6-dehydratase